jgi:hypothetical protein
MAVEGAEGNFGLGGMLRQQVAEDTDEERRRKMRELQQRQQGMSPAGATLFGGMGGLGIGGL